MTPMLLQRHDLVRIAQRAWARELAVARTPAARDCLQHWARADLPLVVATQAVGLPADRLRLGLPAPVRWDRQRLTLTVDRADILSRSAFPPARAADPLLPAAAQGAWRALGDALAAADLPAQVYGSHGWELLTGLAARREGSDLDLLVRVRDAAGADRAVQLLAAARFAAPRLDGELVFPDGQATAWREWAAWRAGRSRHLLVKHLCGARLVDTPQAFDPPAAPGDRSRAQSDGGPT